MWQGSYNRGNISVLLINNFVVIIIESTRLVIVNLVQFVYFP